jgi:hypothetical protein
MHRNRKTAISRMPVSGLSRVNSVKTPRGNSESVSGNLGFGWKDGGIIFWLAATVIVLRQLAERHYL